MPACRSLGDETRSVADSPLRGAGAHGGEVGTQGSVTAWAIWGVTCWLLERWQFR